MHNIKKIRLDVEFYKKKISERNSIIDFDNLINLDKENRELIQKKEIKEQEKKLLSKSKDEKNFEISKKLSKEIDEITKKRETAARQIVFWSLPDVLIVTLKRFADHGKKNQCLVDFPLENLDLRKYIVGYEKESYIYDLFGICNHSGGLLGGHYTASVKNKGRATLQRRRGSGLLSPSIYPGGNTRKSVKPRQGLNENVYSAHTLPPAS